MRKLTGYTGTLQQRVLKRRRQGGWELRSHIHGRLSRRKRWGRRSLSVCTICRVDSIGRRLGEGDGYWTFDKENKWCPSLYILYLDREVLLVSRCPCNFVMCDRFYGESVHSGWMWWCPWYANVVKSEKCTWVRTETWINNWSKAIGLGNKVRRE